MKKYGHLKWSVFPALAYDNFKSLSNFITKNTIRLVSDRDA